MIILPILATSLIQSLFELRSERVKVVVRETKEDRLLKYAPKTVETREQLDLELDYFPPLPPPPHR